MLFWLLIDLLWNFALVTWFDLHQRTSIFRHFWDFHHSMIYGSLQTYRLEFGSIPAIVSACHINIMTDPPTRRWLMSVLDKKQLPSWLPTERLHMRRLKVNKWDDGALRTIRTYYGNAGPEVEEFMFTFLCKFYDEHNERWHCRNASACAVWPCKQNLDNPSLWDWKTHAQRSLLPFLFNYYHSADCLQT